MSGPIAWLPAPLPFQGDWNSLLCQAYEIFERDLKIPPRPTLDGLVVFHDRRRENPDDKEEGFWHLVSRHDRSTGERLPDIERMRRIAWVRATIEHSECEEVRKFDFIEKKGRSRTYLWVEDADFVVILERQRRVAFLVTAYLVDYDRKREQLRRRYEEYCS